MKNNSSSAQSTDAGQTNAVESKPKPTRAEISRANGAKSTGPKTVEGKERSRMNAFKHGILSKILIIGGESEDDFNSLLESLLDDLQPEGCIEEMLVGEIATSCWRLRRALVAEKGEIKRQRGIAINSMFLPDEGLDDNQRDALSLPNKEATDKILRYETTISRQLYRAMDQLERLQRRHKGD
jgi:hypothetical protein